MTERSRFDVAERVAKCDCVICTRFLRAEFGNMQSVLNPHPLPPKQPQEKTK